MAKLLLDSNQLLLATQDPDRLTDKARDLLWDRSAEIFVSAASFWEISLKSRSLKPDGSPKLKLRTSLSNILGYLSRKGVQSLAIDPRHTFVELTVPISHRDPFDHLLLQQAQVEEMRLMTSDRQLRDHPLAIYVGRGGYRDQD